MIWRSIVLGVLCGFSSAVLFYDGPTLYYQGLGSGISWSYETAQSVWKPAAAVTALLILLGCTRQGRPRRAFITAGVLANVLILSFGEAIGKDVENFPPSLDALSSAFIESAPGSVMIFIFLLTVAYVLAFLGGAVRKRLFPQRSTGNSE